jgi:endonuclease YncB( thermonuclease family)
MIVSTTSLQGVVLNERNKDVSQTKYYSVTNVVDGDTIKIDNDGKIETLRLIGMDTPETVDPRKPVQCFGLEASNKAKELLSGKKVYIEKDSSQGELDKYGRTLAYIYREDGMFYNEYMIKQGYAHEYTYNTPYKYQAQFKADQKYAQDNKLGLWSPNTCSGDTTVSVSEPTQTASTPTNTGMTYYTSSYNTSKYYYPESCDGWKSLSTKYLKSFNSLEELLTAYPNRTKSSTCN